MITGSTCEDAEGKRSAGGAAEMAGSDMGDGMAGWTTSTSSAEEGGGTGLGEGEREDGADMAGRFEVGRLGLSEGVERFGQSLVLMEC